MTKAKDKDKTTEPVPETPHRIATPRSFGFFDGEVFLQGTVMQGPNQPQEIAGLWGDKSFESGTELATLVGKDRMQALVGRIRGLLNRAWSSHSIIDLVPDKV
jgi:hypothetical protein